MTELEDRLAKANAEIERLQRANDALQKSNQTITPPAREALWWKSRKFWTAIVTSAAAWAAAISTGGVTVPIALAASAPLMLWIGVEGAIDLKGVP